MSHNPPGFTQFAGDSRRTGARPGCRPLWRVAAPPGADAQPVVTEVKKEVTQARERDDVGKAINRDYS